MDQLKALIEKQGTAFEAFKEANDARIAAIEAKGYAPADLTEKVDKINADLSALNTEYTEYVKRAQRPESGDKSDLTDAQKAHKKAFNLYLRKGIEDGLAEHQRNAMESLSDPDGGYLIVPEMDGVIDRVVPTISAMAGICKNVTIGTAKYEKLVKTSGLSMSWIADGAAGGETTNPKYAKIEIDVFTGEVEPWVYNSTLEDSEINLEADLAEEAAIGFGEGIGAALITGNGVGQPKGIASYTAVANASYAWGSVGYIASGASGAFATSAPGDKIVQLQHALKAQYRPGAVFVMADSTLGTARQMKDGSGQYYLWQPDPAAGFGGRFLGSPVVIDDNMAAIAANSLSIAYGNFQRAYAYVKRRGTILIRDNITSKGKTKFNFTRRMGGGVINFEAYKLMKFASS